MCRICAWSRWISVNRTRSNPASQTAEHNQLAVSRASAVQTRSEMFLEVKNSHPVRSGWCDSRCNDGALCITACGERRSHWEATSMNSPVGKDGYQIPLSKITRYSSFHNDTVQPHTHAFLIALGIGQRKPLFFKTLIWDSVVTAYWNSTFVVYEWFVHGIDLYVQKHT